jgi:uncharacterized membrane protein
MTKSLQKGPKTGKGTILPAAEGYKYIKTKTSIMETATVNSKHKEGVVAKAIEEQTAKLPSDLFLWTAVTTIGVSLVVKIFGKDTNSLFVGQWVAPFLLLGIYNKLVKQHGHD